MPIFKKPINFSSRMGWFLVAAVVLRLALMPLTLHPDLLGHSFSAYFLAYEGKFNLYDTLANLPPEHPLVKNFGVSDVFIYPPLAYYTLGLFRVLVKPFVDPGFIPWLMENLGQIHSYPRLLQQIFFFKLPYLFFDIGTAFLLAGLFENPKKKRLAFTLWLFNPVTLYVTFMIGQLDLLPVFFTVLALFFFQKKKPVAAAFSLGVAASYKLYPLFFLLPFVLVAGRKLTERLKLAAAGILPFLFFLVPYWNSAAFRAMVFSPKSQKMLFMGWPLSGAEVIFPFVLVSSIIYFFAYYSPKKVNPAIYFMAITLLILSVTHFHPQWFLWVTPFLIWELVENNFDHLVLVLTIFFAWLAISLFFEPSLSWGLFNPLWPNLEKSIGLSEIMGKYTDVFQLKSLIRSLLAGASAFLIYRLLSKPKLHEI